MAQYGAGLGAGPRATRSVVALRPAGDARDGLQGYTGNPRNRPTLLDVGHREARGPCPPHPRHRLSRNPDLDCPQGMSLTVGAGKGSPHAEGLATQHLRECRRVALGGSS